MQVRFHISLTAEKYREYYAGNVNAIQVISDDGRKVRFPANVLQPYLTHSGVQGEFVIQFDDNHRFVSINKLA
jgi:hypothetical protein